MPVQVQLPMRRVEQPRKTSWPLLLFCLFDLLVAARQAMPSRIEWQLAILRRLSPQWTEMQQGDEELSCSVSRRLYRIRSACTRSFTASCESCKIDGVLLA